MRTVVVAVFTLLGAVSAANASVAVYGSPGYNKHVTVFNRITCGSYYETTFTCEHVIGPSDQVVLNDVWESGNCWHSYSVFNITWTPIVSYGWVTAPGGELLDQVMQNGTIEIPIGIGDITIDASNIFNGGAFNVTWEINGVTRTGLTLDVDSILAGEWLVKVTNGDGTVFVFWLHRGNVRIVPDTDVAGVVGDLVSPIQGAPTSKHFVTPKRIGSTELYLRLRAKGASPRVFDKYYRWEGGTSLPAPYETNRRGVNRTAASETLVRILKKENNSEVDRMKTWVVWADVGPFPPAITKQFTYFPDWTAVMAPVYFKAVIAPASIVQPTNQDRPNLAGPATANVPNVPSSQTSVWNYGVNLQGGKNAKWDISRRTRAPSRNSNGVVFTQFPDAQYYNIFPNFPSDPVIGNDDTGLAGEDNDPYSAPHAGALKSSDMPALNPRNSVGSLGQWFELRWEFKEFARLQIGTKWYVISDDWDWFVHFKLQKVPDTQNKNGVNGTSDHIWDDNGTIVGPSEVIHLP